MKNELISLPDENAVIETILEENDEAVDKLLEKQPALTEFAREVKSIKEGLQSIEDEDPPPLCLEKKTTQKDRHLFAKIEDLPLEWYKNPYILSFGFLMAIICLYFCIVLLLK
jgi:hypothetical protein